VELKLFATGFTGPQQGEHFRQAIGDIERLRDLSSAYTDCRGVLLVDPDGYLTSDRRERLLRARGENDECLRMYICERVGAKNPSWRRLDLHAA
jgi:hypothetical protein